MSQENTTETKLETEGDLLDRSVRQSLFLSGCKDHPERTDLSCCKIRRPDGTPITTKEAFEVIEGLERENAELKRKINMSTESLWEGGKTKYIKEIIHERDQLAEALQEMRYGHTDKAERMAMDALSYLSNSSLGGKDSKLL